MVYINGVAEGAERSEPGTSYVTQPKETFRVRAGDKVQLYLLISGGGQTAYVRNFRIYYDKKFISDYQIINP